MARWEYKFRQWVGCPTRNFEFWDSKQPLDTVPTDIFEEESAEGWELITVIQQGDGPSIDRKHYTAYFRKLVVADRWEHFAVPREQMLNNSGYSWLDYTNAQKEEVRIPQDLNVFRCGSEPFYALERLGFEMCGQDEDYFYFKRQVLD